LPRLRRLIAEAEVEDEHEVMFVMKILAMCRQRQDVATIARAARDPRLQDTFMWSIVFGQFDREHPGSVELLAALRDPMPDGFARVAFLDMANGHAVAGALAEHPFDTPTGIEQLARWLEDPSSEHFSYARSATIASLFVHDAARDRLVKLARQHPDPMVRIEAAWAQARAGNDSGLLALTRMAGDARISRTAQAYLEELGFADRIPHVAREPDFQALSEMASWLAHPQEYGRPPTAIEILDSRVLVWPPTDDERRLWLVKYTYLDANTGEPDVGVGMVGSTTFALFGETTAELPAAAIYGLHCCWELEIAEDPRAPAERTAESGIRILREYGNTSLA
jgi:hypothetical protein